MQEMALIYYFGDNCFYFICIKSQMFVGFFNKNMNTVSVGKSSNSSNPFWELNCTIVKTYTCLLFQI